MHDDDLRHRIDELVDEVAEDGDTTTPTALARLVALRRLRTAVNVAEGRAMQNARAAEWDWAAIGAALGTTGQAASHRLRRHHQLPDPRPGQDRPTHRGAYRQQ